jgi:hypothetical protein
MLFFHAVSHSTPHSIPNDTPHAYPSHSSGSKLGGEGGGLFAPLVIRSVENPFWSSSSGLPIASGLMKSIQQKVEWPNQQGDYVVKASDAPDASGSRPIYKLDGETGAPLCTNERAKADGDGNWRIVSGTDAAKPNGRRCPAARGQD